MKASLLLMTSHWHIFTEGQAFAGSYKELNLVWGMNTYGLQAEILAMAITQKSTRSISKDLVCVMELMELFVGIYYTTV